MKNKIVVVLFLLALLSCANEENSIPDNVLQPEKLAIVMTDVHLLEAMLSIRHNPMDSSTKLYALYKKDLFKKYLIDDSIYDRSVRYYNTHPQLIDKVYEKIIDSLSLKEEREKM